VNDLLSAIGIPLLRGSYGGNDAQQSRAIQISDLVISHSKKQGLMRIEKSQAQYQFK
jgi:hypothetical protein